MDYTQFDLATKLGILFSGIFLWVGMLTGVWKYLQIRKSAQSRAHYYVDIAHRSSLLYAPATLILAVMAEISALNDQINLLAISVNIGFFSFSILSYILHGFLQDTTNQFRAPHQIGRFHLSKILMTLAMLALVIAELGGTIVLLWGTYLGMF
jgi:hypothetical protein